MERSGWTVGQEHIVFGLMTVSWSSETFRGKLIHHLHYWTFNVQRVLKLLVGQLGLIFGSRQIRPESAWVSNIWLSCLHVISISAFRNTGSIFFERDLCFTAISCYLVPNPNPMRCHFCHDQLLMPKIVSSPHEASTEVTNRMRFAIWAKLAEHSGIAKWTRALFRMTLR